MDVFPYPSLNHYNNNCRVCSDSIPLTWWCLDLLAAATHGMRLPILSTSWSGTGVDLLKAPEILWQVLVFRDRDDRRESSRQEAEDRRKEEKEREEERRQHDRLLEWERYERMRRDEREREECRRKDEKERDRLHIQMVAMLSGGRVHVPVNPGWLSVQVFPLLQLFKFK